MCWYDALPWCLPHMNTSSERPVSFSQPDTSCEKDTARHHMLRHRDLLSQSAPFCAKPTNRESSLHLLLSVSFLTTFPHSALSPNMTLLCMLCLSLQGITGNDAVDQITKTWGEWHQHHYSWFCGARRIHQRCYHPKLSLPGWWWWRHLKARRGRRRAQSPPLVAVVGSVLSTFSLWHLFQEGSCTAPLTLFRAIVNWEIKGDEKSQNESCRSSGDVWLKLYPNEIKFVSCLWGSKPFCFSSFSFPLHPLL